MQVALYARVSSPKQEQEATIDSQLRLLQEYAASHSYQVLPEDIFIDNGASATRLDRPALNRLRDAARQGEFEAVLIWDPDRLARSYPHQWLLVEEFQKMNCPMVFLQNPFGDSPQGKLLAQVQGIIAEYERAQILERTRRGKLEKARRGDYLSWAPQTYGYTYIPKRSGLPGGVMIHIWPEPPLSTVTVPVAILTSIIAVRRTGTLRMWVASQNAPPAMSEPIVWMP